MRYTAKEVQGWENSVESCGNWIPLRPVNHQFDTWKQRLKDAWGVLTGKYDALDWEENV